MGILPLLSSYFQARVWGVDAITLVSGGTVLWVLVVLSTFDLARRVYGLRVAGWSLIPLVCSSLGTIWLSGRITGGHLLSLAWHAAIFSALHWVFTRGDRHQATRIIALGILCGLGLYIDTMIAFSILGLGLGMLAFAFRWVQRRSALVAALLYAVGLLIGLLPREIGTSIDPYDAYPGQFATTFEGQDVTNHARLLGLACLPRLIAGHELTEFESWLERSPSPAGDLFASIFGPAVRGQQIPAVATWLTFAILLGFGFALVSLSLRTTTAEPTSCRIVTFGLLVSAALICLAFIFNRNIFNSDNYRYLIFLLTPWSIGFGVAAEHWSHKGWASRVSVGLATAGLAVFMTGMTVDWYRGRLHYIDASLWPRRVETTEWTTVRSPSRRAGMSEVPDATVVIPPEASHLFGGYWDVYRISFLSGRRVVGVPLPMYPNRFPGWSRGLEPDQGALVLLPFPMPRRYSSAEMFALIGHDDGRTLSGSPAAINWPDALRTVWRADGRDPAELARISLIDLTKAGR
jgi:hypothetical protein